MALVTALDADASGFDDSEKNFVAKIRKHGWFDTQVLGDEQGPGFSYTTGFLLQGSPEFITFSMKRDITHDVYWDLFRDAQSGRGFQAGVRSIGVFANLPVYFFNVAERHQREYLGWSRWFYGTEIVPTLHLVWPDRDGVFPWEDGFDETFRIDQPDLTEAGWTNEISA